MISGNGENANCICPNSRRPREPRDKGRRISLNACPLLDVDLDMITGDDFRDLLEAMNFEARYDPEHKRLMVAVQDS